MIKTSHSLYQVMIRNFSNNETVQKIKPGTLLFQEKDPVQHVYIMLKGTVAVGRVHFKGKEFILKILSGEELLIEYQIFNPSPRYHYSAKTITDCEMLMIKKDDFEKFLEENISALQTFSHWMSTKYLKAQMKCQDLIMNGKKGGLYSVLIRLCNSYGVMTDEGILIDLPLTHQELANLTYGTREVIQRLLKELRENDVLIYRQQKFIVKDLAYLKHHVDCQNCPYEICGVN
ncbi:Crp/Fnr family transcriptional regulator [Neobacillus sp. LXY-4]|uniref:Crp/Fnr family transcriptional regulator n=1 Tax=Neobacillus sp. LXY-4 TaxID=3379826 RepID=UPI003EDEA6BA